MPEVSPGEDWLNDDLEECATDCHLTHISVKLIESPHPTVRGPGDRDSNVEPVNAIYPGFPPAKNPVNSLVRSVRSQGTDRQLAYAHVPVDRA